MAYDVATGRTKVGLTATDTSQDGEILAAMNSALAFAEHYCDRQFLYKRETMTKQIDRYYEGIFVNRYPVGKVHSTSGSGVTTAKYSIHNQSGLIMFGLHSFHGSLSDAPTVTIDYEGGYKTPPADLEFALWSMFQAVWPQFDPSISTGGGGAVGPAIGSVKKRTIVGVGSVEYETGGSTGSGSGTGSVSADWSAVMPGAVQAILDMYSRKVA